MPLKIFQFTFPERRGHTNHTGPSENHQVLVKRREQEGVRGKHLDQSLHGNFCRKGKAGAGKQFRIR